MTLVAKVIIADAADLKDYDYACWTNRTKGFHFVNFYNLNAKFHTDKNALVVTMPQDKFGGMIPLYDMDSINFGNSKTGNPDLCNFFKPAPKPKDVWKNKIESFLGLEPTQ